MRSVARGEVGVLKVGFVGSAMLTRLPAILDRYRRLYSRVQLHLNEFHTSHLIEALREGSADVALARDAGAAADLHVEPAFTEPFVAILPMRHLLATLKIIPLARLRDEPFVFFPRSAGSEAWENAIKTLGFHPNVVQEAPQWLTIVRLVGAGLGVSIAPASVEQLLTPDVVCRKLSPSGGATSIDLVYRLKETNPLVNTFCEVFRSSRSSRRALAR